VFNWAQQRPLGALIAASPWNHNLHQNQRPSGTCQVCNRCLAWLVWVGGEMTIRGMLSQQIPFNMVRCIAWTECMDCTMNTGLVLTIRFTTWRACDVD